MSVFFLADTSHPLGIPGPAGAGPQQFSIFSYAFPLLCLSEEVSVQTLFLEGYWLLFVEIKSSMWILKEVLY